MPKVKICGIRRVQHALAAWEAGADFIGLMFAQSKRQVTLQEGAEIVRVLKDCQPTDPGAYRVQAIGVEPARVPAAQWTSETAPAVVGVFVNQGYDEILRAVEGCRLDYVQLHGDETPEFCRQMPVPVIKAVRPTGPDAAAQCQEFAGLGATLLIDTYVQDSFGGSGVMGNWALAAELALEHPLILAGGLDAGNVAAAIGQVRPWGVDVSSGVESHGAKDLVKIREFVRAVRGAE